MRLELDTKVKERLHTFIDTKCLFRANPEIQYFPYLKPGYILPQGISGMPYRWCFYLRNLSHDVECLDVISRAFAKDIVNKCYLGEEYPSVQLCGLETSSIPLLTGIQLTMAYIGINVNVFSVRKDRKAYGLCHYVDGIPTTDPVVFIDDMINSGNSFYRAMEVCKYELDLEPAKNMYSIVSSVDKIKYNNMELQVNSLFSKSDFDLSYTKEKYWIPKDCDKSVMKRGE